MASKGFQFDSSGLCDGGTGTLQRPTMMKKIQMGWGERGWGGGGGGKSG